MTIGILAVQGAFIEHERILNKLGCKTIHIRKKSDLYEIDGIILPGGESTVQGQLLKKLHMFNELKQMIANGLPTLATCAGLILLAKEIKDDTSVHLGTLPVTVKRNAYGRQLASFMTRSQVKEIGEFPMVFIRAPYIESVEDHVDVLAEIDGNIVAVRYQNQIGLAFHPELTEDFRIHNYFLSLCK